MLRKSLLSVVFVLLFALVQAGIVTHEISHFQDIRHTQQDKNTTSEHCAQCLTMAHADGGLFLDAFNLQLPVQSQNWLLATLSISPTGHQSVYTARAPPLSFQA